ncbi:MAG: UTP--glucose-1-phosphate uridylyltransferase, partial [Ruminococcus sp.]|nr:UTP--glucose-1-phosphate uridylyltransferase [Ruminococcus sp.]
MKGFDNLPEEKKEAFLAQIENINWSDFKLIGDDSNDSRGEFSVPPAIELPEIQARKAEFEAAGLEAIKKGEVGAVLLAGGMGTRLGFDLPKGCYNVGQTKELYIFQCLINNLMEVVNKAGAFVPCR